MVLINSSNLKGLCRIDMQGGGQSMEYYLWSLWGRKWSIILSIFNATDNNPDSVCLWVVDVEGRIDIIVSIKADWWYYYHNAIDQYYWLLSLYAEYVVKNNGSRVSLFFNNKISSQILLPLNWNCNADTCNKETREKLHHRCSAPFRATPPPTLHLTGWLSTLCASRRP